MLWASLEVVFMNEPRGAEAARLRQKKFALLRNLAIPEEALPGSLALTHRRCGKPTCHCAKGKGHPAWSLTFMQDYQWRPETRPFRRPGRRRRRSNRFHRKSRELCSRTSLDPDVYFRALGIRVSTSIRLLRLRELRASARSDPPSGV